MTIRPADLRTAFRAAIDAKEAIRHATFTIGEVLDLEDPDRPADAWNHLVHELDETSAAMHVEGPEIRLGDLRGRLASAATSLRFARSLASLSRDAVLEDRIAELLASVSRALFAVAAIDDRRGA